MQPKTPAQMLPTTRYALDALIITSNLQPRNVPETAYSKNNIYLIVFIIFPNSCSIYIFFDGAIFFLHGYFCPTIFFELKKIPYPLTISSETLYDRHIQHTVILFGISAPRQLQYFFCSAK
ncbi:MAG: hypothetical protein B6I22_11700 [Desulfobacteraceae bacterium 4572_123]|nr:MAG: hypothetical protein B6I22_11700 [Desulfobacteraceae bacterium 4572_123]